MSILIPTTFLSSVRPVVVALMLVLCAVVMPAEARQDASQEQKADELAAGLAERYDGIESMRMRFLQTASSAFMDTDERYSGLLTFSDTSYRIETSNQTIVADGETTWVHNRGERQVIVNDFVEDETAFSLTGFLQSFSDEYRSEWDGEEDLDGVRHDRLRLIPIDDFAAFRQVDLWIRQSDLIVTRLIAVDLNDVRMVFELSSIEVNPTLDGDAFSFVIPEGVDVVDLREDG